MQAIQGMLAASSVRPGRERPELETAAEEEEESEEGDDAPGLGTVPGMVCAFCEATFDNQTAVLRALEEMRNAGLIAPKPS
jgi:hypothetical protein